MLKESFNYRLYIMIPLCITSYYKKIYIYLFVIHIFQNVLVTKHTDYLNTEKKLPVNTRTQVQNSGAATEAGARHKLAMNLLNSIIS